MIRKRKTLTLAPPAKRKKSVSTIEEIKFDFDDRQDYLTGFHKRKLHRIKHAQEEAAKKEREDRLEARKSLRESRKADLEKHVDEVNALIKKAQDRGGLSDSHGAEDKREEGEGFMEISPMDEEAEYIDEERHTTVTIEAVDVTREGIHKIADVAKDDREDSVPGKEDKASPTDQGNAKGQLKRVWTKERPGGPKKMKKKFRYESKVERKATRYKERCGNKAKARARKE